MNTAKRLVSIMLAVLMCVSVLANPLAVVAHAEQPAAAAAAETDPNAGQVNLALHKTAVASSEEAPNVRAVNATDGDTTNGASRWGSVRGSGPEWIYADLGAVGKVESVKIYWESGKAAKYAIQVAETLPTDEAGWTTVKSFDVHPAQLNETITLDQPVDARYVRLYIESFTKHDPLGATVDWDTISIYELEVYGQPGTPAPNPDPDPQPDTQDPMENVALHKLAVASSIEADTVKAENATDGNTTSRDSRWGSGTNGAPHWIYVDLGKEMNVQTIRLYWEQRKPVSYAIQLANTAEAPTTEEGWETVINLHRRPLVKNETITLPEVHRARFVRLLVNDFTHEDPDGGDTWPAVSIYEMEVFGGVPAQRYSLDEALEAIEVTTPERGDTKLNVTLPTAEGIEVKYNGTDLEQVIGDDLTIYQPLVDKTVKVSFKATDLASKEFKFREVTVTVPGKYYVFPQDNPAPDVLPAVQEWKGETGNYGPFDNSKILYSDDSLKALAVELQDDYERISGRKMMVQKGTVDEASAGSMVLTLNPDLEPSLQKEGYFMDVGAIANMQAATPTGLYYATRTLLQGLKKNDVFPSGEIRDYPEYEVRGIMLDVGRKPFTMDFLKQLVQEMAWYKMNDLQIHLNDNYIWLEQLDDPMNAYSAFRLESRIKKGGLNQADLTSTDVFYSRYEFRDLIEDSRRFGVNIVPEIDTPAHSLALTKVRPDLRLGTNGRQNDHLNLTSKYDESLAFVQEIFRDYLEGTSPVFDQDTIVHVGADEYEADKEAYRRFADDMLGYLQSYGRKTRIWGSLSQMTGTHPVRSEGVQMQLWNARWADMKQMYTQGFDLINCNDADYYIVPNAGYYYDYLPDDKMYNLDINQIGNFRVPSGDKQMVGGMFAIWNDMIDVRNNGITEYDVFLRIKDAMPLFAAKLWAKGDRTMDQAKQIHEQVGGAPQSNLLGQVDFAGDALLHWHVGRNKIVDISGNENHAGDIYGMDVLGMKYDRRFLELKPGASYAMTKLPSLGMGYDVRVKVYRTSASTEDQILLEGSNGCIKAVQNGTGKVGFSREGMDFSFDYTLPMYQWVELEFKNELHQTSLWVNGKHVDTIGNTESVMGRPLLATLMLPVEKLGSKTSSFVGYVDALRIGKNKEYVSTMKLDPVVFAAEEVADSTRDIPLNNAVQEAAQVLKKFDPTQEEIQEQIDILTELMQAVDYTRADYTRVDKYLEKVPEDLSLFTADSVQVLQQAVAGVQRDLPLTMQNQVDLQGEAVRLALSHLERRSAEELAVIDPATITATASSYQKDGSDPDKVLDGDLNTMWHSDWSITKMPHWIDLEMEKPTAVTGLIYTPRQGNSNGRATSYRIEKSDDGVNYTEVTKGTWANSDADKRVDFAPVVAKHIRLVILAAGNNNGSAVEIRLCADRGAADVAGLNALIAKAGKLTAADYTPESWAQLQTALADAKATAQAQNPSVEAVDAAKCSLMMAMGGLTLPARPAVDAETAKVIEMLDHLYGLSLQDEPEVKAARAAYEKLTPAQKKQVTNIDRLLFAEKRMANAFEVVGFNMGIGSELSISFYAAFSEEMAQKAVVQVSAPEKPVKTYVVKDMTPDEDGFYKFTNWFSARNMAKRLEMTVLVDGKPVGPITRLSARDLEPMVRQQGTPEQQKMMRSTLYMGAQMQLYKNYEVEDLASMELDRIEELDAAAQAIKPADLDAKFTPSVTGELGAGLKLHGVNMNMDSKTNLRYFFDKQAGYNAADFTFKLGDKVLTPKENDNLICIDLGGISAQYLDEMPELTVTGKGKTMTIKYGPMSYVRRVVAKDDVKLANVGRALVLYNNDANVMEAQETK